MLTRSLRYACLLLIAFASTTPATGQSIPAKGTDVTLDVATWNIEWFGSTSNGPSNEAQQLANVQAIIEQSGIDLWAVQEIADVAAFTTLLDSLGAGYEGFLATESGQQRIGFIYKTDVFSNVIVRHILTTFDHAFAGRPPLQLEADVSLAGMPGRLTFIVLHMKAFSDQDSYERRVDASQRLKNNIDFLRPADPIVVLGDFNDELTGSIRAGQPSPYANFVQDSTSYFFPSRALEDAGLGTFCENSTGCATGSTIDHILVTDELAPFYEPGSADRYAELLALDASRYVFTTSDHLPVFARFRFDTDTAVAEDDTPDAFAVQPAYPNPFDAHTTLTYTLPRTADVRVEVFDVLGRRMTTLAAGRRAAGQHRLTLDVPLPPGLYLLRFTADAFVHTQRLVRL